MTIIDEKSKFVCDVMLGRLARWMRILGYNTLYRNEYDDYELLRIALQENRMLLTRDMELYNIAGPKRAFMLDSEKLRKQLRQIFNDLNIEPVRILKVCPVCNGEIRQILQKDEIKADVAPYTYKTHDEFFKCSICGKIYWHGSHSNLADEFLKGLDED